MPPLWLLTYVGFVSLGLPDAVIGVAWPSVRGTFALSHGALGALLTATGIGFCASSLTAGRTLARLGVGRLLTLSSGVITLALFGFAVAPAFPALVLCALFVGLGSGAIDAGLNTHAATQFSARHVNWLHACYGLGAAIGPLVATAAITRAGSWRFAYAIVGALMLILSAAFGLAGASWRVKPAAGGPTPEAAAPAPVAHVLRDALVWLQVILFFLYTGLEVTLGQWSYTVSTEARGVAPATAGVWTGMYWASLGAGRFLLGFVVDRVGPDRLLRLGTLASLLGSALFAAGPPRLGAVGLVVAGVGLAPIFPTLVSRTPSRLRAGFAAHAIGFQVSAAMLGSVALPSLGGALAARVGLEAIGGLAVAAAALLWLLHEALVRASAADDALPEKKR